MSNTFEVTVPLSLGAVSLAHRLQALDGLWAKMLEVVRDSAYDAYLGGYLFE